TGRRAVAAYLRDDGAPCPIAVLRNLAFAGEKGSKRAVEAGVTGGEMQRHGCWGPRLAPPASAVARWGWIVGGMLRHRRRAPHGPQILELGLDALHVQANGGAVGEMQCHPALRRLARFVAESKEGDHFVSTSQIDAVYLGTEHPFKAQRRAPPR